MFSDDLSEDCCDDEDVGARPLLAEPLVELLADSRLSVR